MTSAADQLVFRMIGTWWRVDLESEEAIAASAREIARGTLGRSDENASARARMRNDLREAAQRALEGGARLLMMQTEIAPGAPMMASLTVYEQDRLRMSPAIGTAPEAVLQVFEESLPQMDPGAAESAVRRRCRDSEVVRTHRIEEFAEVEQGETFIQRRLTAQYWYPVPGSKSLLLAAFSTPLGDIPNVLLSYFDSIVAASAFHAPEPVGASPPSADGEAEA